MATRTRKKKTVTSRIRAAAAGTQDQLLDTVHQVWLAGIGALSKAQRGAPKLFDELVKEGARVQIDAGKAMRSAATRAQSAIGDRVSDARAMAAGTLENLEKTFQARVQKTLQQMGVPSSRDVARLSARVEALNTNIEKLARGRPATRGRAVTRGDGRRSGAASSAAH